MIDWESDPELAELRREFVASFAERLRALSSIIARLKRHGSEPLKFSEGDLHELRVLAHNLAGVAATYGFGKLGVIASELDDRLSVEGASGPASQIVQDALTLESELTSCAGSPASGARS